ncbi:MAG: hypothetical protein HYZ25_04275 [Chloroflexi bacterium]|nr:hypothetical protein [Chloroflexota bacterium]
MQRKIYSQTLKHTKQAIDKGVNENVSSSWQRVKNFVVTLGTISGVLAGVLWLGGRFYAYGYFERMNIPIYFLAFTPGEYAEVYMTSVLSTIMIIIEANIWNILAVLVLIAFTALLLRLIQNIYKTLKIKEAVLKLDKINQNFVIISTITFFLLTFFIAYNNGQAAANNILTESKSVTIYSNGDLLPIGDSTHVSNSSLRMTSGLYLLTYNNEKYYFFRELDPVSCKPIQVYIIPDNQLVSVVIEESSRNISCK